MVFLGLLLILVGVVAILSAVFVSSGTGELLGMDLSSLSIFLVGVAAGASMLWGYSILKWGTKRGLAQRKERKEITELNERLKRSETERRGDVPDERRGDTPDARREDTPDERI